MAIVPIFSSCDDRACADENRNDRHTPVMMVTGFVNVDKPQCHMYMVLWSGRSYGSSCFPSCSSRFGNSVFLVDHNTSGRSYGFPCFPSCSSRFWNFVFLVDHNTQYSCKGVEISRIPFFGRGCASFHSTVPPRCSTQQSPPLTSPPLLESH